MGRSRRPGAGVEVASWVFLLLSCTEVSALNSGYIGSTGAGCTRIGRNVAVASCPLTSRLPKAAVRSGLLKTSVGGSHSWRHGEDKSPLMGRPMKNKSIIDDAAGQDEMNRPKGVGSPWSSSTCLRAVADSSGGSDRSRYGLARAAAREERVSEGREPTGNILQRLSTIALERSTGTIPQPTTSSTDTSLSVLPSDPIERFSSYYCRIHDDKAAVGNNRDISETTPSTSSDNVFTTSGSSALEVFAEASGTPSSSLADRVATELRRRTILSGQLHRGTRNQSGQQRAPRGIDHGVKQLNAVITRVEAKLNFDSSEAGQLRVRDSHLIN